MLYMIMGGAEPCLATSDLSNAHSLPLHLGMFFPTLPKMHTFFASLFLQSKTVTAIQDLESDAMPCAEYVPCAVFCCSVPMVEPLKSHGLATLNT